MATSIFGKDRYLQSDGEIISDKKFYLIVSAVLLFGFAVNVLEVLFLADYIFAFVSSGANIVWFYVIYLVAAVAGICINAFSRKPALSFAGYCLVVLPVGAVLALAVPQYSFGVVRSAFVVTALLAAVFGLLAVLYPNLFRSLWKVLSLSLLVALIWSLVSMLTGPYFSSGYVWLDWIIVLVFCCYIGFDVSLAKNRPKTTDNAVDSACGLYLDLINVFLRLLMIFGRNRD